MFSERRAAGFVRGGGEFVEFAVSGKKGHLTAKHKGFPDEGNLGIYIFSEYFGEHLFFTRNL